MRILLVAIGLALAACAGPAPSNVTDADVGAAAQQAQGDIDTYAANRLAAQPPQAPPRVQPAPPVAPSRADPAPPPIARTEPLPVATATVVYRAELAARYHCAGETRVSARREQAPAAGERSAAGIWYREDDARRTTATPCSTAD